MLKTIREVFSLNLIRLRGEKTQAAIAELAEIPFSTYQKMEAGQIPRKEDHFRGLVRAFKLRSETELFLDPDLIPMPAPPSPREALKSLENLVISLEKNKRPGPNSEPND